MSTDALTLPALESSVLGAQAPREPLVAGWQSRRRRANRERVQRVIAVLQENLAEAPSLQELGRRVGCSPFYLSRLFSEEMGRGIFQHLRELRLGRAAQLLREGSLNVTQVAMEVGYSSPSHFTVAFRETFGCCPGLYPLRTLGGPETG